ncbi:Protein CBG22909 [Caenorhabditis briggsae]|uniref:Protein CBG22909 n=1 Tax=Caenorhabditis briggsae TaxID=6238 RepID=A8Y3C3_CAEBR|nr:Protein CBG22909 [Caenorhabditis briggsae]CAP39392.2 Protein CBG22909 [Caenorhabditis briggsae]
MSNCHPEIFLFSIISQYICSILSIPIYAITFSVLIFKCPKYFDNRYRNYLIAHLVSKFKNPKIQKIKKFQKVWIFKSKI